MNKTMGNRKLLWPFAVGAALVLGCAIGRVSAGQPHMHAALEALDTAHHELEVAEADKGGHRENAIKLIDEARGEVRQGMEFAREHH